MLALFKHFWLDDKSARVTDAAIFCGSDERGASSIDYFANIRLERGAATK